jgi:hypothetical protein
MYKDHDTALKHAQLQAKRRAKLEAKAKAFDAIKALVEGEDYDGVLARIREIVQEVK